MARILAGDHNEGAMSNASQPEFIPPDRVQPPPPPGEEPIVWFELPDGLTVGLRPIHPEDRAALVEGFAGLSEDSRYHRFLTPMARLSPQHAEYLTNLDQVNHFAWGVGIREPDMSVRGIGVARYVRDTEDPAAAEIAVAITDEFQGRRIGGLLVLALAVVAASHGVERITGLLLGDNRPMARIFERIGARFEHEAPGILRAEATLRPETVRPLGDEACRELIRVADRAAHPSAAQLDPPG
jgi:RimJ/RimL family protein N-acetyltransferase